MEFETNAEGFVKGLAVEGVEVGREEGHRRLQHLQLARHVQHSQIGIHLIGQLPNHSRHSALVDGAVSDEFVDGRDGQVHHSPMRRVQRYRQGLQNIFVAFQ